MGNREYVIIESVSDFINYIFNEMQVEDKKKIYFRGEQREYEKTIPGLYRNGK